MRVRFGLEARWELRDAIARYEAQRTGLGQVFINAVSHTLLQISEWPSAGRPLLTRAGVRTTGGHEAELEKLRQSTGRWWRETRGEPLGNGLGHKPAVFLPQPANRHGPDLLGQGLRQRVFPTFTYLLLYTTDSSDPEVVAVAHTSRLAEYWIERWDVREPVAAYVLQWAA